MSSKHTQWPGHSCKTKSSRVTRYSNLQHQRTRVRITTNTHARCAQTLQIRFHRTSKSNPRYRISNL